MAIIAPRTARNWSQGNYSRILKVELLCAPSDPVPPRYVFHIGLYAHEEARLDNPKDPMAVDQVTIPVADLPNGDPREAFYELVTASDLFANCIPESDANPVKAATQPQE